MYTPQTQWFAASMERTRRIRVAETQGHRLPADFSLGGFLRRHPAPRLLAVGLDVLRPRPESSDAARESTGALVDACC